MKMSRSRGKAVKRGVKPDQIKKAAIAMTFMVDRRLKHIFDTDLSHGSQYGLSGLTEWDTRFERIIRRFITPLRRERRK